MSSAHGNNYDGCGGNSQGEIAWKTFDEDEEFDDVYECVLECQSYHKALGKPVDEKKRIVTIRGSENRKPAFNGDTVKVGVFKDNPKDKCYGKVLDVISRGHESVSVKKRHNPDTNLDKFWPGPKKSECSILFCNIIGKEDDCIAAGEKMSIDIDLKFNETEAKKVVGVMLF